MKDDEARKKILARRATFVAAALAGVSGACGKEPANPPQPCLSPMQVERDAEAEPQPCLQPVPPAPPPPEDASSPAPCLKVDNSTVTDSGGTKPPPRPCLKIAPPSRAK